jgi:hypothetical protein
METATKKYHHFKQYRFNVKGVNALLAYAASIMLAGIPPEVCENTIAEVYCSVKKSISSFLH